MNTSFSLRNTECVPPVLAYKETDEESEYDHSENINNDRLNAVLIANYKASQQHGIRMLNRDVLVLEMKRCLKDVTHILGIPASAATVLLREHRWSKEVVINSFYDDYVSLVLRCGVYHRSHPKKRKFNCSSPVICEICHEPDVPTMSMPCGHEFCKECWRAFIKNALDEGPSCIHKTCPNAKCPEIMTEVEVQGAVPDLLPTFQKYQLCNFVEMNSLSRWCPGRGCDQVAYASSATAKEQVGKMTVCNGCQTRFCFFCGEEPHAPCSCKEVADWNEKCRGESGTIKWILSYTKPCPNCGSRIEKNGGCDFMTCWNCKKNFYWNRLTLCSSLGVQIGGDFECNMYNPNNYIDNQSATAKEQLEMDRFLHFYKLYPIHSEAQTAAKEELVKLEAHMALSPKSSDGATDVHVLRAAKEQMVECRRVLKYTNVFAFFYLTDERELLQKYRFEHQRELLERLTENLRELCEKPLVKMGLTEVLSQTTAVNRFMNNFLELFDDGMQ